MVLRIETSRNCIRVSVELLLELSGWPTLADEPVTGTAMCGHGLALV